MKRSAINSMRRNTPTRNAWLAMLGACVAVPHGDRMAALAGYCARLRKTQVPLHPLPDKQQRKQFRAVQRLNQAAQIINHRRERLVKRRVAPRLTALLFDALATLDPLPLENFAVIVRRIQQHNADRQAALPFHDKALRLADVARLKGKPLTRREALQRLGVTREHDEASRERKALTMAGKLLKPEKPGRKLGTRNR